MEEVNKNTENDNTDKKLHISDVSNSGLDEPFGYATTAELMMMFGKSVDEALDIHNELEKIAKGDDI